MKKLYSLIGVLSLSALSSLASVVVPTSYTINTPGEVGAYSYFDDTGSQLTDGVTGADDWTANLGKGNAYEWVGWHKVNPTITFQFGSTVTINTVNIDFNRCENTGWIYIPSSVTIGGTPFSLSQNALPDNSRGYLSFNGSWTGSSLTIDLARRSPYNLYYSWVFVDEVTFDGVSAVPEPSTIIAGALLLVPFGVSAIRYSRKTRVA